MKAAIKFLSIQILITITLNAQWFRQNPPPQGNDLDGVSFTDANNGTAVGQNGTILRTADGGITGLVRQAEQLIGFTEFPLPMQITEWLLVPMD